MHVRTGPETHSSPRVTGKFSCTEVKRPGHGGGGHLSLSIVEVASVLEGYVRLPTMPGEVCHVITFIFNFKIFCI